MLLRPCLKRAWLVLLHKFCKCRPIFLLCIFFKLRILQTGTSSSSTGECPSNCSWSAMHAPSHCSRVSDISGMLYSR
ncbi:hypothetical protein BJX63DRAFT_407646 [Aspergillus granulosus]|uniref:Secreted protein n=1 Tax=Aspergillus granulosus TaxID=176169 RepID=A0ABR4H0F3_9EURO